MHNIVKAIVIGGLGGLMLAGCKQENNYPAPEATATEVVTPVPGPTSTTLVPVPGPTSTTVVPVPGPTVTATAEPSAPAT